ncbi:MAG: alkaline phosphatase [Prolixibacteraceae bacterium]|nr:alkaline phosphatase [Prolixibacteraceae bacterium]
MKKIFLTLIISVIALSVFSQQEYLNATSDVKVYKGGGTYKVKTYKQKFKSEKPKNVVLMIGDGMGVAQVFAGLTANKGHLFLDNFRWIGFSKTQSADNYITDSAAGGTALSSGIKTFNGAIGVDLDTVPVKTILEEAEEKGLATGLVSTSAITHATPASFIAHQASRNYYEAIAADFLKTDIDVFIGGGYNHFAKRMDGRNLIDELQEKGYKVLQDINEIKKVKNGKLAGLVAPIHAGRLNLRGDLLPVATNTALNILKKDEDGFFLMVEGSQIDWGAHANDTEYIIEDMLDFDRSIGEVLDFASKDGETLIVVTADHETGGMAITGGSMDTGEVVGAFSTKDHSAVMVPVFAFGPGAENFTGIMENTDIFKKIEELLIKN